MEPRRADDPASEKIVHDYLLAHEPVFRTLAELREKVNISGVKSCSEVILRIN